MTQFIIAAVLVQVPLFFGALLWAGRRWPGGYQTVPPRFLVLRALWISAYCLLYGGLFLLPFGGIGYWQIPISGLVGWLADARVAILFAPLIVYPYALLGGLLAVLKRFSSHPLTRAYASSSPSSTNLS